MSQYTPIGARLDIDLDQEHLRMRNEWFFKWHHIGRNEPVEIESFNGRPIRYAGLKFSGSPVDVYWDTIQRYLRLKVGSLFDRVEEEIKNYPMDVREKAIAEAQMLITAFVHKIRRVTLETDRILRGNGTTFPHARDRGHWDGAGDANIRDRAETLRTIYCEPRIHIGGEEMGLERMMTDKVTLLKKSGEVFRQDIPARVTTDTIITFINDLPIQVGDHFLRQLPSGLVDDFEVLDPGFNQGLGRTKPHFQAKVRRSDAPASSPQTIIANLSSNARMYINSTDNSVNITSSTITTEQLGAFLAQVKPSLSLLPADQKAAAEEAVAVLETEATSAAPSQPKIRTALQSLRTVCEGATGNLIATGIVGLITQLL